ncbi:GNAT family N-acetyltransferase [Streptomyces sp. NPDC102487]|uniref:GNAT family N-acetyltransferase n=1 Tax=Streptomyces sp. NPDC102487 TaxID=3366182 RepID=UPI00382C2E96
MSAPLDEEWIRRSADELAPRLAPAGDARAFVVDTPDGSVAACALGLIHPVLSAPAYPRGLAARVHIVATHPGFRRRGYARAVVTTLLEHLADAEDVTLFEVHASVEAQPLYRELGFTGSPALMRMTRLPAATASAPENGSAWMPPEQYAETVLKATAFACVVRAARCPVAFGGGRLTAEQIRGIMLNPREHDEVRVLPLAEWEALMPARDFARVSAVEEARSTGVAAYFGTWDWGNE